MNPEAIKRLEEKRGLSPTQVARLLDRAEQTYRRWTGRGHPRRVKALDETLHYLRGMKRILNCSYEDLIDGEGEL